MNNIYTINLENIRSKFNIKYLDFLLLLRKLNLIDNYGMGKGIVKTKTIYNYTDNGYSRSHIHYTSPLGEVVITRIIANNH